MSKQYLTVEDVANLLNVSIDTVRNWIKQKKLEAYKVGRDYRISHEQLAKFMEERRTKRED